jgi:hypothetical protein
MHCPPPVENLNRGLRDSELFAHDHLFIGNDQKSCDSQRKESDLEQDEDEERQNAHD